jgi:hypothetical protein
MLGRLPQHRARRTLAALLCVVTAATGTTMVLRASTAHADNGAVLVSPQQNQPVPGWPTEQASYPRVIRLEHSGSLNGTLLATSEHYFLAPTNGFTIYQSTDNGATWQNYSFITPTANEFPLTWQPTLFEIPVATGSLNPGDLLAAGTAFPPNTTNPPTQINVYKSTDHGATWTYLSTAASAPGGSSQGVWEPDFAIDAAGDLALYYSNEDGETNGGQTINQVTSSDGGVTWSSPTIDFGTTTSVERPGMPTVTKMNDLYAMNIEGYCNGDDAPHCLNDSRDWVATSPDGDNWGSDPMNWGNPIQTADGHYLSGTPYSTWTPGGGPKGTLLAS